MKKIIITGILSVAVLTLTNCTNQDENIAIPNNGVKATLKADISAMSRTIAEGLSTRWAADDALRVWLGEGDSYAECGQFTLPEENVASHLFVGDLPNSYDPSTSYDYYALYPYSTAIYNASATPDVVTMLIGTNVQRQTEGYNSIAHISGSVAPLYGVAKSAEPGTTPRIQMKHLSTLVKVNVTNYDTKDLEVLTVTINSTNSQIAGRAHIDLTGATPTYDPVSAATTQAILRVTSNSEVVEPNGSASFYVALIPFTAPAEGEKISITVAAKNNDLCTRSFTIPANTEFKAGEINEFNLKYKPEEILDLDAEGTANCYIVTKAGHCSFKATKGNSLEVPAGITNVRWLWISEANIVSNLTLAEDNEIHFASSSSKGNAVIAGLDENDNIVWSWHIWLTDDPRLNLHSGASDSYKLLDRNLGATSTEKWNPDAYGLYYQWGRKDPFPGPKSVGAGSGTQENAAFTNGTAAFSVNVDENGNEYAFTIGSNSSVGTTKASAIAYTIAHPMEFITSSDATWWNSTFSDYEDLWGFNAAKTIYDPCPAGYRVPRTEEVYAGMAASHWLIETRVTDKDRNIYAYEYTGGTATARSYYPSLGFRDGSDGIDAGKLKWTGAIALYWSNQLRTKSSQVWCMEVSENEAIYAASRRNNGFSARGCPVRCVKE